MKIAVIRVAAVALLLAAQSVVWAQEERTLTGEFVWNRGDKTGDLRALFKATGKDRWDVAFYFKFRGDDHVYRGSAQGTLGTGALKGEVLNDDLSRTFAFEGQFVEGVFKGTHAEIKARGPKSTGTLTLR